MSDILIKGTDMPKDVTLLAISPDGTVDIVSGQPDLAYVTLKHKAVPVPPHGRLGDLDNFALLVLNWISTQEKAYPHEDSNALAWRLGAKAMANQIYRDVKAYPTIIPAEEGET